MSDIVGDLSRIFIKIGAVTVTASDYIVPSERTFREAWAFSGGSGQNVIGIDMEMARRVWRDKIRQARKDVFPVLDAAFIRALETGADTSSIVVQKQALRDAPADPAIDAATTPDELKLVQPAGLVIK
jgi:hypothetical protein